MSEKRLDSRTITKRNVAQSTVIFSVVVAVITLVAIGTVAYFDFSENAKTAAKEKSIPEMIAEIKKKSALHRKQAELAAQSEDLVATMDKRVANVKELEKNLQKVDSKIAAIKAQPLGVDKTAATVSNSQQTIAAQPSLSQPDIAVTAPSVMASNRPLRALPVYNSQQLNALQNYIDYRKTMIANSQQYQFYLAHQNNASMDTMYSISLHFSARGKVDANQSWNGAYKAKTLLNGKASATNNWNAKQL